MRVLRPEVSVSISQVIGMGVWVFYPVFLLSPLQCTVPALETVRGCVSLKKQKSRGKAVEVSLNSKEENS
jgi:hypothetical protein